MRRPATRLRSCVAGLAACGLLLAGPQAHGQPRRALSAQCAFNHECAAGLVCAASFCRAECATDRDCADGKVCLQGTYDAQDRLVHAGPVAEAAPAGAPILPGGYFGRRCQPRAAQPAAAMRSPIPAGAVVGAGTAVQGAAFQVTGVTLRANLHGEQVPCPATVLFTGAVSASASGAVSYRIVRSDGASGPVKVLKFAAAGAQPVSEAWSIGATGKGSMTLQVLSPNALASAPAVFALECSK